MTDRFALSGTAVVTGASKGIGRAVADRFAAEGAEVAICARTESEIESAAAEIANANPGDAIDVACDVRDCDAVEAFVDEAVDAFGEIDALVNNAGASFVAGFDDISPNGWASVVDVNLTGTVNCTQAASEHLADGASVVTGETVAPRGVPDLEETPEV